MPNVARIFEKFGFRWLFSIISSLHLAHRKLVWLDKLLSVKVQ